MKINTGYLELLYITSYKGMYCGNVTHGNYLSVAINKKKKIIRKDTDPPNTLVREGWFCHFVWSRCTQMDLVNIYLCMTNTQIRHTRCWCFRRWHCGADSHLPWGAEEKEQSATLTTRFTNFLNHKTWYIMSAVKKVRKVYKILEKAWKILEKA